MRPNTWTAAGLTVILASASVVRGADNPASTPPAPVTPADNELNHAKRSADRTANDAGKTPADAVVDKQADNARRDAKAAVESTGTEAVASAGEVRRAVALAVALAVTPDHMDRLTQRFAKADRDRIRSKPDYDRSYGPALDDAIAHLAAAWDDRYHHHFTSEGCIDALNESFATVAKSGGSTADTAQLAVAESHGLPKVTATLHRESPDGWKLNVADGLDATALRKALADTLTPVASDKDHWPADESDAYRAVAHRVLLALQGTHD